jgi:hypothetical protein
MSLISKIFSIFLVATAVSACSNITISTDYAVDHDFSGYTTYQWHPSGPPQTADLDKVGSDIFDRRLTRLTEQKLTTRGINKGDTPQFYINYSVVTEEQVSIDTYNSGFYGPRYYGNNFYGSGGFSDTRVRYFTEGTLIIDIIDANKNLLVWRASATSKLKPSNTPQQNEANMNAMLDQILAGFPPQ